MLFRSLSKMREYPEYPDANLLIELIRSGVKISEIAVEMRQRDSGTSMHGGFFKPVKYMFMMSYSIVIVLFRRLSH